MANWMNQHEVLAAVIFVALSFALIAAFAYLERRYKQNSE
jgi:ABC-type amino acid transport system permease subunit